MKLITDHVRRAPGTSGTKYGTLRSRGPYAERPCEYMNCRRPRAEHERAFRPRVRGSAR